MLTLLLPSSLWLSLASLLLAGVFVTLLVALTSGSITGLLLKSIDFSDYEHFKDNLWIDEPEIEIHEHKTK